MTDTGSVARSLPDGWFIDDDQLVRAQAELARELPPGHLLSGRSVRVVAIRDGTDDVLCRHVDDHARFTVIHLSWLGREELDAHHPTVEVDGDFDAFLRYERAFLGA